MLNIGVIGLGSMGQTHLDAYRKIKNARVVAVADTSKAVLEGKAKAQGNINGQAQNSFDYSDLGKYESALDLIDDPEVELVDICLPTPLHRRIALAAIRAGKNIILEKPTVLSSEDAWEIINEAKKYGVMVVPAHCMRFWPGWDWLKEVTSNKTYGKVFSAHFERIATHPGRDFFLSGTASGGALFDLHLHDTDFISYCFGLPEAVSSQGHSKVTDAVDYVSTNYDFGLDGPTVTAIGAWSMAHGTPFQMRYCVNFADATAVFDLNAEKKLMLYRKDTPAQEIILEKDIGYFFELQYFVDCIEQKKVPQKVSMLDAANTTAILEAERNSIMNRGHRTEVLYHKVRLFKIGVISDSFKLPLREGIKTAKRIGVQGIQLYAVRGEVCPGSLDVAGRRELKHFIAEHGLEIAALCGDLGGHGFERADENADKIARSKAIVDLAVDLGTKVVTTHIGVIPTDKSSGIYRNQLFACRELARYAHEHGVTFAIETGPELAVTLKSFLDDVATLGIGVNLDPANFVMVTGDDPVQAVFTLRDYIVHTHAKDGVKLADSDPVAVYGAFAEHDVAGFDFGKLFNEVPLGEGTVAWNAYLDALEAIGYQGYLTIEREVGSDPESDIHLAVAFLRKHIQMK